MTALVSAQQIAKVAGVTVKHVRRMMCRARGAEAQKNPNWFGAPLDVIETERGAFVAFPSLPKHIREALLLRDQPELPLPPPPHPSGAAQIKLH